MLVAALLMFLFASLDVAFHLRHNLEAFVYFDVHPIETFEQTSNWINVMKMACYVAQTFIGDSILVSAYALRVSNRTNHRVLHLFQLFRCWIVYSKRWLIVIVPILLWLGTTGKLLNRVIHNPFLIRLVCGIMTVYIEATLDTSSGKLLNASTLVPFITSMLCLTLATNLLTTCMFISGRMLNIPDLLI